jgi:hypothetical protein
VNNKNTIEVPAQEEFPVVPQFGVGRTLVKTHS